MRLMIARSRGRRKTRGRGLPPCGRGVTVPISMNPNPRAESSRIASPLRSKPAASPTGFGKRMPKTSRSSDRVRLGIAFAQQPAASGNQPDDPQQEQDGPVGLLDGEREENRFYDALVHVCMFTNGQKYEKRTDSAKNIRGGRRNGRACTRNLPGSPSTGGFRP